MRGKAARKEAEQLRAQKAAFADLDATDKDLSVLHNQDSKGLLPGSQPPIGEGAENEEEEDDEGNDGAVSPTK